MIWGLGEAGTSYVYRLNIELIDVICFAGTQVFTNNQRCIVKHDLKNPFFNPHTTIESSDGLFLGHISTGTIMLQITILVFSHMQ